MVLHKFKPRPPEEEVTRQPSVWLIYDQNYCTSFITLDGLLTINFSSMVVLRVSISSESPKTWRQNRREYQSIEKKPFVSRLTASATSAVNASRMSIQWILSPGTRGKSMLINLMVFGLGILRGSFSVSQKSESLLWNKKKVRNQHTKKAEKTNCNSIRMQAGFTCTG